MFKLRCKCTQGLMAVFNAFAGAVFLTVGLTHLLPEVIHYQAEAFPDLEFPLGLALAVMGFMLILFIEQIVFDVHGAAAAEEDAERDVEATLLERTLTVGRKFQGPLLTLVALCVHAVLESIILGLAVRALLQRYPC